MKRLFSATIAACLHLAFTSDPVHAQNASARANGAERILNGEVVDGVLRQVPWAMSLRLDGRHWCGASFVAPKFSDGRVVGWSSESTQPQWAITAAHCVTGVGTDVLLPTNRFTVQSGALNIESNPPRGELQSVLKIYIPDGITPGPDYDPFTLTDDIALLRLSDSTETLGVNARASIRLPDISDVEYTHRAYTAVHTAGWGRTSEGGVGSPSLLEVRLPMVDPETCAEKFRPFGGNISVSTLCAGYVSGEFDACQGDSGGSLFYRPTKLSDTLVKPVLVGVVSWGRGCGRSDLFGVYSNIAYLQDWIIGTIEAN